MKKWMSGAIMLFLAVGVLGAESIQAQSVLVAGYPAARDVPGARELPDPNSTYKVVFDISKGAPSPDKVNPGLVGVARFVNTLAKYGVTESHRRIAVVFHQEATWSILDNEAYKAHSGGVDNPDIALIGSLKNAGVTFHVCGQSVLAHKIDPKTINPNIELDLWALTTLVNLELKGYVHVGG